MNYLIIETKKTLEEARLDQGLSRTALAQLLGTTKADVSGKLNPNRNITLRTLSEIAGAMGYTVKITLEDRRL
jgi:transcriptional regulator with XRE-family HTH domain